MKNLFITSFLILSSLSLSAMADSTATAPASPALPDPGRMEMQSKEKAGDNNGHPYDQLLSIQIGPYKPKSIAFTNWNNNSFNYDSATLSTFQTQLGWGIQMFRAMGSAFYFQENITYANFSHKLPADLTANPGDVSVTMHMFGFDTRLSQSWETFPVSSLVPFWDAGVLLTLYSQNGPTDLTNGEGTTTNLAAGAGFRYWINHGASLNREFPNRYEALPIFLTVKLNKIFSNNGGMDPAATSLLGGVTIGL